MTRFQRIVAFALAFLVALPLLAAAPRRRSIVLTSEVTVSGIVRDATTSATVASVNVTAAATLANGNSKGAYSIKVPSGRAVALTFERTGYETKTVTVAAAGTQVLDVTLTPKPTTKVTLVDGTVYELDSDTFVFAYNIPFISPVPSASPNLCAADGTSWQPSRGTIAKVIGPATIVRFAPCCPNEPIVSATFQLKDGSQKVGYFKDSCVGYTIDVGGIDHITAAQRYIRLTDVKEVQFP